MSNNCIAHLPPRLGDLRLVQLDLSNNQLGNAVASDWDWLNRPNIKSSLQNLNLSSNQVSPFPPNPNTFNSLGAHFSFQLTYFPCTIVKLHRLVVLTLKLNQLCRIPFGIRRLKYLRTLNLERNRIKSLPNVMSRMSFETLDLSGEEMFKPPFYPHERATRLLSRASDILQQPAALWQIAAQVVMLKK